MSSLSRARHGNDRQPLVTTLDTARLTQRVGHWLDSPSAFVTAVSGASGSGKSTFIAMWNDLLGQSGRMSSTFLQDWYYRDKSQIRKSMGESRYWDWVNLDTPKALSMGRMHRDLARLIAGKSIVAPGYDYRTSKRTEGVNPVRPNPFVSVDGIFSLHGVDYGHTGMLLADRADLGVFVQTPMAELCQRWWKRAPIRNVKEDAPGIAHFVRVMDMYGRHIQPSHKNASIILDGSAPTEQIRSAFEPLAALLAKLDRDKPKPRT